MMIQWNPFSCSSSMVVVEEDSKIPFLSLLISALAIVPHIQSSALYLESRQEPSLENARLCLHLLRVRTNGMSLPCCNNFKSANYYY
jgi:hypothetical protein